MKYKNNFWQNFRFCNSLGAELALTSSLIVPSPITSSNSSEKQSTRGSSDMKNFFMCDCSDKRTPEEFNEKSKVIINLRKNEFGQDEMSRGSIAEQRLILQGIIVA